MKSIWRIFYIAVFLTFFQTAANSEPVGTVVAFAGKPKFLDSNWVICNGQYLSAKAYPEAYRVLGYAYLPKRGAPIDKEKDYFPVPDYRGYFLRGADLEAGRDSASKDRFKYPGETDSYSQDIGSIQLDTVGPHKHRIRDAGHTHRVAAGFTISNVDAHRNSTAAAPPGSVGGEFSTGDLGRQGWHFSEPGQANLAFEDSPGPETRPKNISVIWIIKVR